MNFLFQLFVYLVLAVAGSIVQAAATQETKKTTGVRSQRQEGGDNYQAVVAGKRGLGGQFEYWLDWGQDGETPNAYHTEVYSLGDKPYHGFVGMLYDGGRASLAYDRPHASLGIPVNNARLGGKDHMWVKFYDGRQTAADAMLVARSAGSERPWTADMIFVGCPYVVVTTLLNRELFTAIPKFVFEVEGIDLYDMSLDSSVGGDGPQRYDDPSTWSYSDDPIVAASNVALGIYYGDEWLFGGQTITPHQLPAANWIAQIRKSKARGFRCGYEIVCGADQPHAVMGEFLMAAAARIAEIGGLYKVLVAEPDAPVRSFTDDDIVITESQELDPFPGLESTCNVITSTYPEPAQAWTMKEAPTRYSSALEAADGGRRLPKEITYRAVWSGSQVQQLDKLAVEEARRFRTHINTMPPEWWEMEPLDAELWTSARNGYVGKLFLITAVDDGDDAQMLVARREQDPADYDWSPEMELPWDVAPLGHDRPAPQITTGFSAAPYVIQDGANNPRRAAIEAFWDAGLQDVRLVRVQVRESWGSKAVIADATIEYDIDVALPSAVISNPAILPAALYEVRGLYVPFSGRITRWSNQDAAGIDGAWISVTTPDVRLGSLDVMFDQIAAEISQDLKWLSIKVRDAVNNFDRLGSLLAEQDLANFNDRETLRRDLIKKTGALEARFTEIIEVALGPGGAIAQSLEALYAAMGGDTAQALVRWSAEATPVGVSARWGLQLTTDGSTPGAAAILVQVRDGDSEIVLDADRTVISTDGGTSVSALFNEDGALIRDLTVGTIKSLDGRSFWNLTTGLRRSST